MGFSADDLFLICENCRGDRVRIDTNTGEYYCEDCGIQQQEIRELDRDVDDIYLEISNGPDGRRGNIRRASQSTEKLDRTEDENSKDDDPLYDQNFSHSYNKKQIYFDKWINKKPKSVKNSDFLIGVQLIIQHTIKDMVERRQISTKVLRVSRNIWFLFLEYLSKNAIPIRAFFADLRCSVLKVPFNETNSSSSGKNITAFQRIKSPNIPDKIVGEKGIIYDLYNSFGFDRVEYLSKICKGIIRHSNSMNNRKKIGNNTPFNEKINGYIIEEWEISARKLQFLANERNIPYLNWYGESQIPRSDLIKCVIDMIYEHDFLECYFNRVCENQHDNNDLNSRFNEWIYFHANFFIKNRKINSDYISISKYLELPENEIKKCKDIQFLLHKVYVVHSLLYKILDGYLRREFKKSSLSDFLLIHRLYTNTDLHYLRKRKIQLESFGDNTLECPKIDYSLILCIIWISLLKSGYQVTSFDIIEWVKTGKIDIFKSENIIPKWLRDAGFKWDNDINSNINTRSVTQISRIPNPTDLERIIYFFSKSINIVVPPINVPIIIHRILVKCELLGNRGGISIQPLCIRLWEFLMKEGKILDLFGKLTIAPSIIIVIARSIWPIFVYHCIPNSRKELEHEQINSEPVKFNSPDDNKSQIEFNLRFDCDQSSWILKKYKTLSLSEEIRFFSIPYGIEWSGILAINWLFTKLMQNMPKCPIEASALMSWSKKDSEPINERKGRPTTNFRGNFFGPIRKERQSVKKKFGRNNWSGILPKLPNSIYHAGKWGITALSRYIPSNREIFHSMLFRNANVENMTPNIGKIKSWDFMDDVGKEQIIYNWEKALLPNKETENSTILKGIINGIPSSVICPLLPLIVDNNFLRSEGKCFNQIGSVIDYAFNLKQSYLRNLFQDPGMFTSVVLPLPQFIHSRQKFTNSEVSIPTPYSTLLLKLTEITGESYLNIHNCVIKIEEILTDTLNKK
ncbi:hypothetical protein OJ252_2078 [Cryptosporidium canis]|uniref:TFIIB-type domain-containing protein n=1 Tax=Cryptosporidium canis TaxID=195482 RepID=A0ABQ8P6M6_9CRYT|nr:hypothetical protein OJ252_2078 [Cryptosporidium canis]